MSYLENQSGGGSGSISIGGTPISNPNFSSTTPAAPGGDVNVTWQVSGSNISGYVPLAASTPPGGSSGDIQYNNGSGGFGGETLLPLANGGTDANLSLTGGTSYVLRQSSVGAAITVGQLGYSELTGLPSLAFLPLAGGTMTGVLTLESSAAGLKDATGSSGSTGNLLTINASGYPVWTAPATSGTVTTFSAGTLSPLFTTTVGTSSSTPALSFSLSNAAAGTVLGNATGSAAGPTYTATPVLGLNTSVAGTLGIANGGALGTTITIQNLGNTTAYNFNLPTTADTAGSVLTTQGGGSASMTWTTQASLAVNWSAILAGSNAQTGAFSTTAPWTYSKAGAASTPAISITGALYTGGTGTTTFPLVYINDGAGPTAFSTAGTEFGINAPSGFTGNLEAFYINGGTSIFSVGYTGAITSAADANINGITVGLGTAGLSTDTAIGYQALYATDTGGGNLAIGYLALTKNTSGSDNLAIGYQALAANVAGNSNLAIGYQALAVNTGGGNLAIGYLALTKNISGTYNTGIGGDALYSNTSGSYNIAIGYKAGYTATAGNANVSGANNVWIGYEAGPGTSTQLSNSIAIGYLALSTASNQISLGNSSVTGLLIAGTAGVTQTAEAVGTIATICGIVTTFTAVSDERLKIFTEYEGGLSEILSISPIRYRWNEKGQDLSGQKGDRDYIGFSANNVQKSIPEAIQGYTGEERYLSFEDRPVIAALVNAVKTLSKKNDSLEAWLLRLEMLLEKGS